MDTLEFVDVCRKCILGEVKEFNGDIEEYLTLFKEHSLSQFLYPVFKKSEFKKYYYGALAINECFDQEVKKITDEFFKQDIICVFMKGFYLKNLYPSSILRVMGDVDLLVRPKDVKKVTKIMLDLGFKIDGRAEHHIGFNNGKIEIEIHHMLIPSHVFGYQFFKDWEKHLVLIEDKIYRFEDTYHLVFLIAHYAKHMLSGGSGIRSVIDMYILTKKGDIDYDYLIKSCIELEVKGFLDTIFSVIDFIYGFDKCEFVKNENVIEVLEYIKNCGVHGFKEENNFRSNAVARTNNKFTYLLSKVFLPYRVMKKTYPWTTGYILLPFGYLYRIFSLVCKKSMRKKMGDVVGLKQEDLVKSSEILEKMGFK